MNTHTLLPEKPCRKLPLIWTEASPTAENSVTNIQSFTFANILNQAPSVTWIMDVRSHTYTFISDNTLEHFGYSLENYTAKGPEFQDEIKLPEDRVNTWKLFGQVWQKLATISSESRKNFRFSYDYRIVKPDGKVIRILEQNTVLEQDAKGNITHLLGVCNDITQWKRTGSQLAALSSTLDSQYFLFTSDNITPVKAQTLLSKRELEIVKLIAEGHSSKFIADKLFISFHTVNTHRQKMIEKTSTRNTGGLVQFAFTNGLI